MARQKPLKSAANVTIERRTFVKAVSAAAVGLALGCKSATTQPATQPVSRRRYAIVGLGSRSGMYQKAIEGDYKAHAQLVGICDTNPGRLEVARSNSQEAGAVPPAAFAAEDF